MGPEPGALQGGLEGGQERMEEQKGRKEELTQKKFKDFRAHREGE